MNCSKSLPDIASVKSSTAICPFTRHAEPADLRYDELPVPAPDFMDHEYAKAALHRRAVFTRLRTGATP
jgi:hypothetical protein